MLISYLTEHFWRISTSFVENPLYPVETCYQTFDGQELYPTKQEKGARLGYTLISNHAFVDGNKRIGMYVMLAFLQVNGIHIHPTNEEVARVGIAVAAGEMEYEELLEWVRTNSDNTIK